MVLHDPSIDRTTDGAGLVVDLSADEVRQADAGSWCGSDFTGERIPLLEEVLDLARHRAMVLIEIKAEFITERILQVIDNVAAGEHVILQSFNSAIVERVKLLAPVLPTALLVGQLPTTPSRVRARRMVQQVLQVGANVLAIWHATLTPPFLEEMRKRGVAVWAWTVDQDIIMRDLAMMGVHGIITNYPDQLNLVLADLIDEGHLDAPLGRRQRLARSRWNRRRQLRKLKAAKKKR